MTRDATHTDADLNHESPEAEAVCWICDFAFSASDADRLSATTALPAESTLSRPFH
ncbi:hypothetical protein [Corynebacterium sp. CCM 9204]|uniref:hypothetical protein n=1 Tax=Corynebacterium sp. CCM 9204 TaxID=3057616 RepID=UPI003525A0E4